MAEEKAPGIWAVESSNLELFESGILADVEVKCDDHTWKLHKNILCTRSVWFKKALIGSFKESETGVIKLQEQQQCDIECFLKFIYTGSIDLQKSYPGDDAFVALMRIWKTADFFRHKSLCDLAVCAANSVAKKHAQAICTVSPSADLNKEVEGFMEESFVPAITLLYENEMKHLLPVFATVYLNLAMTSAHRLSASQKFRNLLGRVPSFAADWNDILMKAFTSRTQARLEDLGEDCHKCGESLGKGTVDTRELFWHTQLVALCDKCYQLPIWLTWDADAGV